MQRSNNVASTSGLSFVSSPVGVDDQDGESLRNFNTQSSKGQKFANKPKSRRDIGHYVDEADLDDPKSMLNAAWNTGLDTVFYQKWGALGFALSGLFSIQRYIAREPYMGGFIPKVNKIYELTDKNGKVHNIKKAAIEQFFGSFEYWYAPYFMMEQNSEIKEAKAIIKSYEKKGKKSPYSLKDVEKAEDAIDKVIHTINNYSKKQIIDWITTNPITEQEMHRFIEENWNNREKAPQSLLLKYEHTNQIQLKDTFFKQTLKDNGPLDVGMKYVFWNIIHEHYFDQEIKNNDNFTQFQKNKVKWKMKFMEHIRSTGVVSESITSGIESALFRMNPISTFVSVFGPIVSGIVYTYKDSSMMEVYETFGEGKRKLKREGKSLWKPSNMLRLLFNVKFIEETVQLWKTTASGLKRIGNSSIDMLIQAGILTYQRKNFRDYIEDYTQTLNGMMRPFSNSGFTTITTGSGKIKKKNMNVKDHFLRPIMKYPIKVVGDVLILGGGTVMFSMLRMLWNKYIGNNAQAVNNSNSVPDFLNSQDPGEVRNKDLMMNTPNGLSRAV